MCQGQSHDVHECVVHDEHAVNDYQLSFAYHIECGHTKQLSLVIHPSRLQDF